MFLQTVETICNEAAKQDEDDGNFHIPRCDELGHFIKYANGVKDPDFCHLGIYDLLSETFIYGTVDRDLEVKVGFQTGLGSRREHGEWYSAYVYCRRWEYASDPSHEDWAWRVVIMHAGGDNPTPLYGRKPRFDSIPEFLDWYSSWLDHFDIEEDRKQVKLMYGSDEKWY
ncbi:hypothetical protein PENPOL_c002G01666 [Penicillium polonicum]|uniref:Uncharacterized protein n=1 Tax=Penicillium polonicum TaxID=60169 RepID=A0A1V6NYW7_PENPO|nr:hypothetical protein PENPOL_c002G01666 [Penicillium polonicum]